MGTHPDSDKPQMRLSFPLRAMAKTGESAGTSASYQLHSELAQYCFPSAMREDGQSLAWINSICLLFLILGLAGLKNPVDTPLPPPPIDDSVPHLFEPVIEPQVVQEEAPPDEVEEASEPTDTPQVVTLVAAPDTAAFAVPVKGPVALAPTHLASPPPLNPPKRLEAPKRPVLFTQMGEANTPAPRSYPPEALRNREQGKVMVEFKVETNGVPYDIKVLESSGSDTLDRFSADWVRKRWTFQPGDHRHYMVPFVWQLQ